MRRALLLLCPLLALAQSQVPVFKASSTLQSIAVQVTDREGNYVQGLSARDFTLLEDGRPQKIAFFAAERQPISLAVLVDSSSSMELGGKLERARTLFGPLLAGHHADDEIFLIPFTDRLGAFEQLTPEQRLDPPILKTASTWGGTALYDALASALCHLQTARNIRQAVVVLTDGADQDSRLRLDQLIELARASSPQIFMIGFYNSWEYEVYRERRKTVTLLGGHEIDNPIIVFERLAKESGAESFFPSGERDLKQALDRISAILRAQYTLAYYPQNVEKSRRIQVKVSGRGVRVMARRGVGSESGAEPVRFNATTCEVSAVDHPYPWESRATVSANKSMVYREDFSDPATGWPNQKGSHYTAGGYELSSSLPPNTIIRGPAAEGVIAAYGPRWDDLRASVKIEGPGALLFRLTGEGYYAVVLRAGNAREMEFQLIVKTLWDGAHAEIIPWTRIVPLDLVKKHKLSVECAQGQITVLVDDREVGRVKDDTFSAGIVGLALFVDGRAVFHDLMVESLK